MRTSTLAAVALAVLVVVLGAFTRLVDAGLGCPDWPGCYGFLTVPGSEAAIATAESRFPDAPVEVGKAWAEMVHRYFAGALGLAILGLAIVSVRQRERLPWRLPLALLVLVICQAAFGAWTVTLKLWPQVVTAHLLGGFATLMGLWLLALRLGVGRTWRVRASAPLAAAAAIVVVLQIALGGWVSSNYAALACGDFPTCHGELIPELDVGRGFDVFQEIGPNYLGGQLDNTARITIHFAHRVGALIVLAVLGALIWRMWRAGSALTIALVVALGIQLALGIANVVLVLPLAVATAHNAGGAALLGVLVAVNYRALAGRREQAAGAAHGVAASQHP